MSVRVKANVMRTKNKNIVHLFCFYRSDSQIGFAEIVLSFIDSRKLCLLNCHHRVADNLVTSVICSFIPSKLGL